MSYLNIKIEREYCLQFKRFNLICINNRQLPSSHSTLSLDSFILRNPMININYKNILNEKQ